MELVCVVNCCSSVMSWGKSANDDGAENPTHKVNLSSSRGLLSSHSNYICKIQLYQEHVSMQKGCMVGRLAGKRKSKRLTREGGKGAPESAAQIHISKVLLPAKSLSASKHTMRATPLEPSALISGQSPHLQRSSMSYTLTIPVHYYCGVACCCSSEIEVGSRVTTS